MAQELLRSSCDGGAYLRISPSSFSPLYEREVLRFIDDDYVEPI